MLRILISVVCAVLFVAGIIRYVIAYRRVKSNIALFGEQSQYRRKQFVFAFFHPYCAGGGGGERVLWIAVRALIRDSAMIGHAVIYACDGGTSRHSKAIILSNVEKQFGIVFSNTETDRITIVFIRSWSLLEAKWYPVATMVGQSIGSMLVALECVLRLTPDVFCDTTGAAFAYPLVTLLTGAIIVAYVHYPTISTDMISRVRELRPSYNNNSRIATSIAISHVKVLYYKLFARLYGMAGSYARVAMVNSTWTRGHIRQLWFDSNGIIPTTASSVGSRGNVLRLVYPPCNTSFIQAAASGTSVEALLEKSTNEARDLFYTLKGKAVLVSIGQFRPEKDHLLQIRAMKSLQSLDCAALDGIALLIVGSTRNEGDDALFRRLEDEVLSLQLQKHVFLVRNSSHSDVQLYMAIAKIGIHTMWNEHFGISIVEMLASGLVVIAHNSGGPKLDIINTMDGQRNGYLAETPEEYASTILHVVRDYANYSNQEVVRRAKASVMRFSDEIFCLAFVDGCREALL